MKKRIICLGLILIFLCSIMKAQRTAADYQNFKKYWWYHYRLLNDFMVKGDCQGCSEAMNERERREIGDLIPSHKAKWGDQTITLGMYISVLATEYRLLKNAGQPIDTTIQELYYALKAFNRLDNNAESFFRCPPPCSTNPQPGDLNGFFIRDDVDENFFNRHPKLRQGVTSSYEVFQVNSDYEDPHILTNEESHDQVWHLLMGMVLISELVDGGENYGGMSIKQEAIDITDRMINYIKGNNWILRNPVSGDHVDRGDDVELLSFGAAEAACFIKDGNTDQDWSFPQYPINTCKTYHDAISYADAVPWNAMGTPPGALISFSDEDYKAQVLAAIGHSWYTNMYPFLPNPITILVSVFDPDNLEHPWNVVSQLVNLPPVLPENVTSYELGVRAVLRDWQHLPLLHQLLHGGSNPVLLSTYYDLLDSAPCEGPYNFSYPSNSSSFEWSTDNRMLSPDRRGEYSVTTPFHNAGDDKVGTFHGEYNGLDYMLYHNLFALTHGIGVSYFNYMDRKVTLNYPHTASSLTLGNFANPITIEGFNSIDANNVINSTGDVDYRAGVEIHLGPGFHAVNGSEFHAYIDPFQCDAGDYRLASTSNDSSNDEQMQNAVAYAGQTTFINYPPKQESRNNTNEEAPESAPQNILSNSEVLSTSASVSSTSPIKAQEIRIQPNPNNGSFEVIVPNGEKGFVQLTLLNIFGTKILQQQITGSVTRVDISGQPKGIYYVRIENEEGVKMEKIIYQ